MPATTNFYSLSLHDALPIFLAALPPEPRLAIPAEPGGRVEEIRRVDPDHAGLDLGRDVEREIDVLGPDARRQSVRRIVRELHGLGRSAEGHRDQYGSEDFDLRDARGGRDIRE